MIRTADQYIEDMRRDLADAPDIDDDGQERDTLWTDGDLLRYLNSAAAQLASDTLALRKRITMEVAAGTANYRFPWWQVIEFLRVDFAAPMLGGNPRKLEQFDIEQGVWRDDYGVQYVAPVNMETTGTPSWFTRDYDPEFLRLYPIPYVEGVLTVYAIMLPSPIFAGMPLPFQAQQDYDLLLLWAKNLAYRKQDADTIDLTRADAYRSEYKATVRDRRSEVDRIVRDTGILRPR